MTTFAQTPLPQQRIEVSPPGPGPAAPAAAVPAASDHYRRTASMIWLAAGVLVLLTWWHALGLVSDGRARELAAAERDLANLTRVSQEHASRTLRSADQVIRFVQSRYLDVGDRLDLRDLTAKGVIDAEIFNQVGIIDAQGIYILSNLPINGRMDLSDREHFKVHVAADSGELFVSKPVLGRASGKWSIQLTRRITRPDGEFAGVVVVSIDPGYFARFYGELNLGAQGLTALYGLDGVARVRKVGTREEFGSDVSASPMFTLMARGESSGAYTSRSVVDGVERIYYFRKVPRYALVVVAGLDVRELLLNHERAKEALWLQALLVTLLIIALAAAVTRYLWQIRREIVAHQTAQIQIEDRTEQLNAIFAMSPDGFVAFDRERRVKYVSPAFVQLTVPADVRLEGLDESEFSAWLATRCGPGTPFTGIAGLRAQGVRDRPGVRQLIEIAGEGKRVLQVGLRCSEASTVSQILYVRDVTHETEVDEMKSEFLSTAAHELRTPMASIFGFAEVLLNQELDAPARRELLDIIYRQSQAMARILDELLDLARIEARRGKDFRYAEVCLQELVADVAKAFKQPPGRLPPELVMPDQPLYVAADVGKLRQAIVNVLSNAYKYSPAGGAVVVRLESVSVAGRPQTVCIHVADQGIGMSPEQVGRVCERFYRADTSGKFPGTGLGMSIVKEIIELHGGDIAVASSVGAGTRVSLCLPAQPAWTRVLAPVAAGEAAAPAHSP